MPFIAGSQLSLRLFTEALLFANWQRLLFTTVLKISIMKLAFIFQNCKTSEENCGFTQTCIFL